MGRKLVLIAEVYKAQARQFHPWLRSTRHEPGLVLLDVQEHRELFAAAGFSHIEITTQPEKVGSVCWGPGHPSYKAKPTKPQSSDVFIKIKQPVIRLIIYCTPIFFNQGYRCVSAKIYGAGFTVAISLDFRPVSS